MSVGNLFKFLVLACCSIKLVSSSSNDNMDFIGFHTISHMPYAASDMAIVTFPENFFSSGGPRIYLSGGCISDQACSNDNGILTCFCQEITDQVIYFTPEDNQWHSTNSFMPRSRYRHMAAKVGQYMYLVGGRTLEDALIAEIDRFDPVTGVWESNVFTWPNATSDGGAFAVDDLLFLVGGYDGAYNTLASLTALNTTSGEWIVDLPSMQLGRGDIAVTAFEGNNFYVLGGWNAQTSNGFCTSSQDVEYYSYNTNSWASVQDMMLPRGDLAVGVMDGSIFAVGGETKDPKDATCSYSIPIKYVERFQKSLNLWDQEESIPDDLFRFSGVSYNSSANVYNSAIYLFGGQGTFDSKKMVYPVKDTTIKYIPRSTVHSSEEELSAGGIAGIVLAGVIVLGAIVVGVIAYLGYRRRYHYRNLNDIEAQEEASTKSNQNNLEMSDMKDSFEATL